ncbi:MAG: hypothetical protein KGJ57_07945 [Sphingomonadales bacterium]|nr:hypothetical protein [Sphingomonadales bacterium]MDE2169345.1 hypothetical protein [Sphingomonadales bacterium]
MRLTASLAIVAGAALSFAQPALAEDAPAKPVKAKRICRVDPSLGSVMPRYVCHSKEEWAEIDKASAAASDNALNGSTGALGNGGSGGSGGGNH